MEATRKCHVPEGEKVKEERFNLKKAICQIGNISWIVWAFSIAAALNFAIALKTGSALDFIACLLIMIGMAGIVRLVD